MLFVADVHARFERIHPFRDGNGRVGRLSTNLLSSGTDTRPRSSTSAIGRGT